MCRRKSKQKTAFSSYNLWNVSFWQGVFQILQDLVDNIIQRIMIQVKQERTQHVQKNGSQTKKAQVPQQENQNLFNSLSSLSNFVLHKKYTQRQVQNQLRIEINKLILNQNKITTQLRVGCTQKEYMVRFYTSQTAITKLQSSYKDKNYQKDKISIRIVSDRKIDQILSSFIRSKGHYLVKMQRMQNGGEEKNLKNESKLLSTAYENSETYLKILLTELENMIQSEFNLFSRSVLEEIQGTDSHFRQMNPEKLQFQKHHTAKKMRTDEKNKFKKIICERKGGGTPVICIKPMIDEYGIVKCTRNENRLKSRKANKRRNENSSNESKKTEISKSKGSLSNKKDSTRTTKKRRQEAYNPKKGKKKQFTKLKSIHH